MTRDYPGLVTTPLAMHLVVSVAGFVVVVVNFRSDERTVLLFHLSPGGSWDQVPDCGVVRLRSLLSFFDALFLLLLRVMFPGACVTARHILSDASFLLIFSVFLVSQTIGGTTNFTIQGGLAIWRVVFNL